jgi:hypothetical protein
MKQLTLARIVDLGTELAVMALTVSRAQTDRDNGDQTTSLRALYWLESGHERVDGLFRELKHNSDGTARRLATEMMEAAEPLEYPEVNLEPQPNEYGLDITSGRQDRRLCFGGKVREAADQASK